MKRVLTFIISLLLFALLLYLASCTPPIHCRTVKREATCRFMQEHPIKDTIGDLRHSYVVYYHAGLYPDEMERCMCNYNCVVMPLLNTDSLIILK